MIFIPNFVIILPIMYFIYILHGNIVGLELEARTISLIPLVTNDDLQFYKSSLHIHPSSKCIPVNLIKSDNSYTFVAFYNHHRCLTKLFLNIRSHSSQTKRQHLFPFSRWLSLRNYPNISILLLLSGDIELNLGPTGREEFMKILDKKKLADSAINIFSPEEIEQKICILKSQKPTEKNARQKWQRVQNRFKLVSYQSVETLYLHEANRHNTKRVLVSNEIYDVLEEFHVKNHEHSGRTKLYQRVTQYYFGVTEELCGIYVKMCPTCHLKRGKKSIKSVVTKPIVSRNYLSRGQIDLIDFTDMNLAENMSPDGVTPYKYLFVYIDHFTKK